MPELQVTIEGMMKNKIWCPLTIERKERTFMNQKILIVGILLVIGGGIHFDNFSLAQEIQGESVILRPVEQFVHQSFVDSLPFEKIKQYGSKGDTVKRLIDLLKEDCTPYCSNILAMLGIIGGELSGQAIINFLQSNNDFLVKDKADALMVLGYWINNAEETKRESFRKMKAVGYRTNNAEEIMSESLNKMNAEGMEMAGDNKSADRQMIEEANGERMSKATIFSNCLVSEIQNGKSDCSGNQETESVSLNKTIVRKRAAITGLALTGSKNIKIEVDENGEKNEMTVKDYLELLLKNSEVGTSKRAHIIEALEAHNGIAALGLACYYDKGSNECQGNIKEFIGQNKLMKNSLN